VDSQGSAWTASNLQKGGNVVRDLRADISAEAVARQTYEALIKRCDDEGTKKVLVHLLTRSRRRYAAVAGQIGRREADEDGGREKRAGGYASAGPPLTDIRLSASNQLQQGVRRRSPITLGMPDHMESTLGQRHLDLLQQPSLQARRGHGRRYGGRPHSCLHGSPYGFVGRQLQHDFDLLERNAGRGDCRLECRPSSRTRLT
jgi:hypothetical protein